MNHGSLMNKEFLEDLIKAQKEIKPIPKKGNNPHFHSEYAEYDDVIERVKVTLNKYNMFISHSVHPDYVMSKDGLAIGGPVLTTIIYHTCGDSLKDRKSVV